MNRHKTFFVLILTGLVWAGFGLSAKADELALTDSPTATVAGASVTPALSRAEQAKQKMLVQWAKILDRLENRTLNKLDSVADRIDARITKMEQRATEQGKVKDLAPAKAKLAEARTKIATLKTDLATIKEKALIALGSDTPKTTFKKTKDRIKDFNAGIKSAHSLLVEAVTLIKGASANPAPSVSASVSPAVSPSVSPNQ